MVRLLCTSGWESVDVDLAGTSGNFRVIRNVFPPPPLNHIFKFYKLTVCMSLFSDVFFGFVCFGDFCCFAFKTECPFSLPGHLGGWCWLGVVPHLRQEDSGRKEDEKVSGVDQL